MFDLRSFEHNWFVEIAVVAIFVLFHRIKLILRIFFLNVLFFFIECVENGRVLMRIILYPIGCHYCFLLINFLFNNVLIYLFIYLRLITHNLIRTKMSFWALIISQLIAFLYYIFNFLLTFSHLINTMKLSPRICTIGWWVRLCIPILPFSHLINKPLILFRKLFHLKLLRLTINNLKLMTKSLFV